MITEVDDFFTLGCGRCDRFATADCSARLWDAGLWTLRRIALETGLTETVKWGHPCYMHAGRNVAIIGAFRGDFRLTFFNAALLSDPDHVLEKQGPNTRHPDCLRFVENAGPLTMEVEIRTFLAQAKGHAAAGILAPKEVVDLDLPSELAEAFDIDPDLAGAFHALTPGRQRSWVILLTGAKTTATRLARIEKARPRILAGKGALDR